MTYPENQPQYGQPQYGQPQYGQPQYGQPQYGQPYGYGYPSQGYATPPATTKVTDPVVGWLLLGLGVLGVIGSVGTWATVGSLGSINGTDDGKDGTLTLVFMVVVAAMGIVAGLRQGRLWVGIVALVFGALTALTGIVDSADLADKGSRAEQLGVSVNVGWGLWIVLLTGIGAVALGIVALVRRHPR